MDNTTIILYNGIYHVITPGIVVGAWPCGTIVMLAELFGSESKPQVYGVLHTFIQENQDATSQLRKLICSSLFIHIFYQ